jgi:hypothetical protein
MRTLWCTLGLVAVLGCAACGGSSSLDLASLVPADNEVSGWTEDPADSNPGVVVAHNKNEAEALVDGDADPFSTNNFVAFAWQLYVQGDHVMDFRIWEMADAAACASLYSYLAEQVTTYKAATWSDETIGDMGRSAETATKWWINACADKYFLEAKVGMADGSAPDETAHSLGVAFLQAVAAKI